MSAPVGGGRGRSVAGLAGAAVVAWLASWALPSAGSAQEVRRLSLEESVRMGLQQNQRLRAARADAAAAESVFEQVRADRLPAVRSQASYTRLSGNIPGVDFTLPGTDSTITFQGVQLDRFRSEVSVEIPLLTQIRLAHASRSAAHEAEAAELTAEQERSDVAFEVRRAYWELYRAVAVRDAIGAALARVDADVEVVRARLEEGTVLPRDLLAAQTRRSEVRLEQVEAENAVRVAELELNRLIGLPLDTPVRTTTEVAVTPADVESADPPLPAAEVVRERPAIGALAERVQGFRAQLRAAEAARVPDLGFVGRYVWARPNPYFFSEQDEFRGTWELGLSARWAIWEGGRIDARAGEARARMDAAEARLEAAVEEAAVEVARRRLEVRRSAEAAQVARQAVQEAEESYRVVRRQFAEGAALVADVLDAEEALRRARARAVEARADWAIARAAVVNALGRGG